MKLHNTKIKPLVLILFSVVLTWIISGVGIYLLSDNWSERGTFGDMFGAVNALFSGLALAALIYTIILQREEIKQNRAEIELNRKELSKSVKAQQASQKALKQQAIQTHLSAQINAVNTMISYYNSQIENLKSSPEIIEKAKEKRRTMIKKIDELFDGLEDLEIE